MVRTTSKDLRPGTVSDRIRQALAHPAFEAGTAVLILVSIALILLEHALDPLTPLQRVCAVGSDAITAALIGELFVRWLVATSTGRFLAQHWLDVIAVLPLLRSLRMLRLLAILRLMRVGHYVNRRMQSHRTLLGTIAPEYTLVAAIVTIVVITAALGIHTLERGRTPYFDSVENSFWWSLFTLMASEPVGAEPATRAGRLLAATVMMGGLTMFAVLTGFVSAGVIERLRKGKSVSSVDLEDLRNHIVIAGYNRSVAVLVSELHADPQLAGTAIVIVSEGIGPKMLEELEANRDFLHFCAEDYTRVEVLRKVGIPHARMCILVADSTAQRSVQDKDARTFLAAMLIERMQPGIFTCAQLLNSENEAHLRMVGVEEVVLADQYTGSILASSCRAPGIVSLVREVFSAKHGNQIYRIPLPGTWVGRTLGEALPRAKAHAEILLISVISVAAGKLIVNPPTSYRFAAGDELLAMAESDPGMLTGARALERVFDDPASR